MEFHLRSDALRLAGLLNASRPLPRGAGLELRHFAVERKLTPDRKRGAPLL